jgi:hypothetical protein
MKRLYRKLVFQYSEGGLGRVLQKSILFVLRTLYSENLWNIYVHRASDVVGPSAPLVQCKAMTFKDLVSAKYYKVVAFPEEIRRRLERNNTCYGFYLDGNLATIGWSSNDYMELDRGVNFPCPTEVGLFDFITLPDFRSRGLYTNALRYLVRNIHEGGARCIYIAVDPNNLSSVKGIQSAGFSPFLGFRRRKILGIDFQITKSLHSKPLADESSVS